MKIQLRHTFEDIISIDNLLSAWREFLCGKRNKPDVQEFSANLMDNILLLHNELVNGTYRHGSYYGFFINDPKSRHIHKANARDRVLHHAIYRILYPFFNKTFISDSFSCRKNKGTHKAINRFRSLAYKVSKNNTRTCWVLKCDIKKFFNNIDHVILLNILNSYIPDQKILSLLKLIIKSFAKQSGRGLPLGNLTSQLLVNIYMNEFDQFMKHNMKTKHYIRYADDFVVLSHVKAPLVKLISQINDFLTNGLALSLHPKKVFIKTWASGVDFLGWVHFPAHRVLRTATKKKMMRKLKESHKEDALQSYLGLLGHGNAHKLAQKIRDNPTAHQ